VHARQAGDVVRVAALVERYSVSLVAMGEHVAARDAVSFLVEQGAGDGPLLATVAALIAVETGAPTAAHEHLSSATEGRPGEPPPALAALQGLVRSRLAGVGGDPDRMARTVAELATVGGWSDPDLVALGRLDMAIERSTVGRLEEARLLAEEVLADARRRDQGYLAARALAVLAAVAGAEGDYRAMDRWTGLADSELSRGGWHVTAAATLTTITGAYAALLDARPLRCLDLLDRPGTAGPSIDALDPMRLALRAAALVDLGHADEAAPVLRRAQVGMAARPLPANVVASAALLVHGSATDAGRREIAAETVRVAQDLVGPTGDVLLMRARSAVAQARSGANGPGPDQAAVYRAAAALRPVLDGSARVVVPWAVTEGHVLACDLALTAGRPVQARRELTHALGAAARSGALRPLLAGGPGIVDLLAL
jgi:LuxR family transcriptional regulator, maltose regulon positive regulatory protein